MRIAFLIRALGVGGAERQLTLLARGLAERGHEVIILVFYGGGELEKDIVGTRVRLISLGKGSRWDVIGFVWRLVRHLRDCRPQVVYSFLPSANVLIASLANALGGARVLWGVRSTEVVSGSYDWLGSLLAWFEARMSKRAAAVICNSRAALAVQQRLGVEREKLILIRNVIDGERFRRNDSARTLIRGEWGLHPDSVAVGIVGRLDPTKGHVVFLRAAARAARMSERLHFVIVGDGPVGYRDGLCRTAAQCALTDRLTWVPSVVDIVPIYSALDVICSASYGESFSNTLCEGMACGCIAVATDVGDSGEIVSGYGSLIAAGDALALADAMVDAVNRVAVADRHAMREHILSLCSANDVLSKTEAAFVRVVGQLPEQLVLK